MCLTEALGFSGRLAAEVLRGGPDQLAQVGARLDVGWQGDEDVGQLAASASQLPVLQSEGSSGSMGRSDAVRLSPSSGGSLNS
jgi:hypothetical protein